MEIIGARTTLFCLKLLLAVFSLPFLTSGAGEIDPTFNPALIHIKRDSINRTVVRRVVVLPDGKVLIAGLFRAVHKSAANEITRLNVDGTVDPTFRAPEIRAPIGGLYADIISALAVQPDGKILIGGNFVTVAGLSRPGIARLNSDGSHDPTFASGDGYNLEGIFADIRVSDIEVGADGKITFGGIFTYGTFPDKKWNLARVLADGTLDASFNTTGLTTNNDHVLDIQRLPDGSTLVAFANAIRRVGATGSSELNIPTGGPVARTAVQPDGKILVGGEFTSFNGFPVAAGIVRLNPDYSIDVTFTPPADADVINDLELLSNGKILIGGSFNTATGVQNLMLLNSDGTRDNSVSYTGPRLIVFDMGVQLDGKIVVGAEAGNLSGVFNPPIVRLNPDGSPDPFQIVLGYNGRANDVLIQPDGRILIAGFFTHTDGRPETGVSRVSSTGVFDTNFDSNAFFTEALSLDLEPNANIWVGAMPSAKRLNENGTQLYSAPTVAQDVQPLPDGRVLLALDNSLRRLNVNNTLDASFNIPANAPIRRIVLQPDGKILVAGFFTTINGVSRGRVARLNADGSIDNSFNPPSGANNTVNDMALQSDGKIIIGGPFSGVNFDTNFPFLARLNPDGSLDNSFAPPVQGEVTSLRLQPDNKILVGGVAIIGGVARNTIKRFNFDGTLDPSFDLGSGMDGPVRSIKLHPGNKILIGGEFRVVNGVDRIGVARLANNLVTSQLFDYDGDAKADISVFRASENRWYVFKSSDSTVTQTVFAIAGDVPVPADYDGDLKTDVAIYRPSNGAWWYLSSLNGAQINVNWGGEAGDIPRPSDFDGDGKTDFIIFRPTHNTWYRISPLGGVSNVQFGLSGDKPVIGDFDGDGKSDVAIFRPSTGDWWYQSSINNAQLAVRWGISTDIPAPADFDGDGRTDFAVYRPSTGVWYVINSSNGSFLIGPFGIPEDKPVPADYDGDGKAELAVFRPSSGIWYQLRTNGGFFAMQFGIGTDTPTPNAFVP